MSEEETNMRVQHSLHGTWFCLYKAVYRGQGKTAPQASSWTTENLLPMHNRLFPNQVLHWSFMHRLIFCTAVFLIKYRKPKYRFAFTATENTVKRDVSKLTKKEEHSSKYFKILTKRQQRQYPERSCLSICKWEKSCSQLLTGIQKSKISTTYETDSPQNCKGLCFCVWKCNAI